jgi:hypothetical protein
MPVVEQSQINIDFTGGLNTEATALNFPENAAVDLDNFDLFRTGELRRRLGLEFESSYVIQPISISATTYPAIAVSSHEWKAVNGKGELNFLVVQMGLMLYFHDLGNDPIGGISLGSLDLSTLAIDSTADTFVVDTSYGEGSMVVTSRKLEPAVISYDEDTQSFSATQIEIKIRDFDGIEELGDDSIRPPVLSPDHKYNLRNQGWPVSMLCSEDLRGDDGVFTFDPITFFKNTKNVYPSNVDIVHLGKLTQATDPENVACFHPDQFDKIIIGNSPAPKGHFIINPITQDRAGVSGITGLDTVAIKPERPTVTEFYAGRVWYAGIPTLENAGDIFFSQTIDDMAKAGRCYQEQDPTAEDVNLLVATDGGRIHIADMGRVQRMIALGQDLVLIASNGIWAISGADGANFTADAFTVRKISDIGTLSSDSVVEAEGALFFWNEGGIYSVSSGQIDSTLVVDRLTRDTIQGFYDEIREEARAYARGFYDDFNKKIYWFYNDTLGYDSINFRFDYNRALVLDLTLGSFYPYSFSTLTAFTPQIAAMLQKTPGTEEVVTFEVIQGTDDVIQGTDNVVQDIAFPSFADAKIKLLTVLTNIDGTYTYTFSEFKSRDFRDWTIQDQIRNAPANLGADYLSVIQTGYRHQGDTLPVKHITHVTSYFNRTEDGFELDANNEIVHSNPSGGTVQTRWEWTDLDVGRWTKKDTAYRLKRVYIPDDVSDPFDYGFTVVACKLRMRGKGHAFSVRYESETGKDMQLLGFGINLRAGSKV